MHKVHFELLGLQSTSLVRFFSNFFVYISQTTIDLSTIRRVVANRYANAIEK